MVEKILMIIGLLIALMGILMIYDARILTDKLFSFGDKNEGTKALKTIGLVISVIGGLIIAFI